MRTRVDKIEGNVNELSYLVNGHGYKISSLEGFKETASTHIQHHVLKLNAIEGQQKSILDELILMRGDTKLMSEIVQEWVTKTNDIMKWQLKIKYILIGALIVVGFKDGGVIGLFKTYMEFAQ